MKRNYFMVLVVMVIFFVISFMTNILGPLIPSIINDYKVSKGMAAFLPFSFFIAYGLMSIPAGMMTEKLREKKVILIGFLLAFAGSVIFASFPFFQVAMISLFLIGLGMAILQVTINPLLRVSGGEEHFAFNSVLAQLCFGGASFLSPVVYSSLVQKLEAGNHSDFLLNWLSVNVPHDKLWVSLYWVFAIIALLMLVTIAVLKFPKVDLKTDEKTGNLNTVFMLFSQKKVRLFFLAIFAYVGTEQGIANWMSEFLRTYHGMNPLIEGAKAVSWFWGMLTVGCILGLFLLKLIDSKLVLRIFTCAALITLSLALFGNSRISFYSFIATGFFASVMWSVLFSLALNSLESHHGTFAGILCTGIMGGAIVPLAIGALSDFIGLRFGMLLLYLTLSYILYISITARPLIANKTIFDNITERNSN